MALSVVIIIAIQLLRIAFKSVAFIFIERTLLSDVIISCIFMIIMIAIIIILYKKKVIELNIFPNKFSKKYIVLTVFWGAFLCITPIITKNYSLYNILSLIYSAVITVIFEELVFRELIWNKVSKVKNELVAYAFSTVLFGIWHIGYIDTILWRTTLFFPNADILNILIWKVITALGLGIIFGFCKYKSKNTYFSMLSHSFINTLGS